MEYVIGILGLAALYALYLGLALGDRSGGCGGCILQDEPDRCRACPVPGEAPPEGAGRELEEPLEPFIGRSDNEDEIR